jgi:hypothetical protein
MPSTTSNPNYIVVNIKSHAGSGHGTYFLSFSGQLKEMGGNPGIPKKNSA